MPLITGLGGVITYFYDKPGPYETKLLIPGIIGALVGYLIGSALRDSIGKGGRYWIDVSVVSIIAFGLHLLYAGDLLERRGIPPWYPFALYPTFVVLNAAMFALFALAGLRFDRPSE